MKFKFVFILLLGFLSCKNNQTTVLELKTDLPEVLPLIEQFNKESKTIKIIPTTGLSQNSPDLIIYQGHPDNTEYKLLDLSGLFLNKLNRDNFYNDVLKVSEKENGEIQQIPLAFDIPGLMYNKNRFKNPRIIRLEDFMNDNTIKFSPYWDMNFVIWYYLSNMPTFQRNNNYFDSDIYEFTSKNMKYMITNSKDKWNEDLFNKKYMYLSPEVLIKSNIIEYYYINFSDYVEIDTVFSSDIGFSFISRNDLLITDDSIIYTAIVKDSKKKSEAKEFILWLFNKKNQNSYITNNIKDGGVKSLFLGKLSTLTAVSEEIIPYHYPNLAPFIPKNQVITSPQNLPHLWESLKKQVFIPAFLKSKSAEEENYKEEYMSLYEEWYKKHKK